MSPRRIAKLLGGFGAVAVVSILAITVFVVRHRAANLKPSADLLGLLPGTLLHAHDFHWTQMKGNQSQWVLKAKDANYSNDKTNLILTAPEITLISNDGKRVDLEANLAQLKIEGGHITHANMSGGITVHYGDFVMSTDAASFVPDHDQLDAAGPVTIDGPEMHITAIGMSGHPKAQTFQLLRQVSTRITPGKPRVPAKAS